jgi:CRISPR-associated endonuclease Cas2
MSKKYGTFTSELLSAIGEATGFFSWPPEGTSGWVRRQLRHRKKFYNTLRSLKQKGFVKEISKSGQRFFSLTSKGELELLVRKAGLEKPKVWDNQWRIIIFDIPEDCREYRDRLRWLLRKNDFFKLQQSVFVSPYPLNREAISYLKQSGLIDYIRIIRANEIDDDRELRKRFGLRQSGNDTSNSRP